MTKFFAFFLVVLLSFSQVSEAKYNNPEGGNKSKTITNRYFHTLNESKDGEMTLEQYKAREITRGDRRNMRSDEKEGLYLNDDDRFKAMDTDGDEVVTKEEMEVYIKSLRQKGRNFY